MLALDASASAQPALKINRIGARMIRILVPLRPWRFDLLGVKIG